MHKVKVLCHGQMTNAGVLFHDQTRRQNPGDTDARGPMNLKTEPLLQKGPTDFPRQKKRNKEQEISHAAFPKARYSARYCSAILFALKRVAFCKPSARYFSRTTGSRNRSKSFANPSSSSIFRSKAASPATSDIGGASQQSTGQPQACASAMGQPKPSKREGKRTACAQL